MAVASIGYLYISQVRGRKIARSIHRADLFAAGGGGAGSGGDGGSGGDANAVDVTSDEFVVTQTRSISTSVQLVSIVTRNRATKTAQSVDNPVSSSESGDTVATDPTPGTLEVGPEDIKLLKGELRLSDDEIKQHIKLFSTFDVDASGYLTVPELSKMFELGQGVRVSEQTIKKLMADIDEDNDGNISFSEFVQVMVRHTRQRDANGARRHLARC